MIARRQKRRLAVALSLCAIAWTFATPAATVLTVQVDGLVGERGTLYVLVAGSEAQWRGGEPPVRRWRGVVTQASVRVRFENLPAGSYAVRVMQDLNGNGRLERNWIGWPSEPYGFSAASAVLGPPSFAQCRFELAAAGTTIVIPLQRPRRSDER